MKRNIGKKFFYYRIQSLYIVSLLLAMIIFFVLWLLEINEILFLRIHYLYLALMIIYVLSILATLFVRKRYENKVYFEIKNGDLRAVRTYIYTFFIEEKVTPLKNILGYEIAQNFVAGYYNMYIVKVNCGSDTLKLYVDEDDIVKVEDILRNILEKGLEYRRYEDE